MNVRRSCIAIALSVAVIAAVLPAPVPGQAAPAKKPLAYDAYDSWRSIQGTALSRDGVWLVYALVPQDGDGELVARNLETGLERRVARGKAPVRRK